MAWRGKEAHHDFNDLILLSYDLTFLAASFYDLVHVGICVLNIELEIYRAHQHPLGAGHFRGVGLVLLLRLVKVSGWSKEYRVGSERGWV